MSFFKQSGSLSSTMTEHFLQSVAFTALAVVAHFSHTGNELLLRVALLGALFLIAVTCFLPLRVWKEYNKGILGRLGSFFWTYFKRTYFSAKKVMYFFILLIIVFLIISNFFSSLRTANNIGFLVFILLWIVFMSWMLITLLSKKGGDSAETVGIIFSLCGVIASCVGFVKGILEIAQCGTLFTDWAMTVSFAGVAVSALGMFLLFSTVKLKMEKAYSDAFKKF